jgi:hypothetical protein
MDANAKGRETATVAPDEERAEIGGLNRRDRRALAKVDRQLAAVDREIAERERRGES